MGDWGAQLQEYLVDNKSNYAACIGFAQSSFQLQFVAPEPAGWDLVYAAPSDRPVMQEDGTSKSVHVDEHACIMNTLKGDEPKAGAKTGLWIGGLKYQVLEREANYKVAGAGEVCLVHAKNKKKGVHIVQTKTSLLIGLYDEEKGQAPGFARTKVLAYADYLIEINM